MLDEITIVIIAKTSIKKPDMCKYLVSYGSFIT